MLLELANEGKDEPSMILAEDLLDDWLIMVVEGFFTMRLAVSVFLVLMEIDDDAGKLQGFNSW